MEIDLQKHWYISRYCGRKFSKKVQLMYQYREKWVSQNSLMPT